VYANTPLFLKRVLPFAMQQPIFWYRLNAGASRDARLIFYAKHMYTAGIRFNPQNTGDTTELFNGLHSCVRSFSQAAFAQTEVNYLILSFNALSNFYLREKLYVLFFIFCAAASLGLLCFFPSVLNGIGTCTLALSIFDAAFLLPALLIHCGLTLAFFAKKKRFKTLFFLLIPLTVAPIVFSAIGDAYIFRRTRRYEYRIQNAKDFESRVTLSAQTRNFLEFETVTITASSELPVVRCDISLIASGRPPYGASFPFSVDTQTSEVRFDIPENPPNPFEFRYLCGKNEPALIKAVFFLIQDDRIIVRESAEILINQAASL
jgi:hypothetical protein